VAKAGAEGVLGKSSGDTPCAVQCSSNSATADRLTLGGGGAPALESAATGLGGGSVNHRCAGAVGLGRRDTRAGVGDSDLRGTAGALGVGLTYVMRRARSVSCAVGGADNGATCAGTLVRTMSAVAIVTPDAAAVLATRSVFETGSARSRISHVRDCSRLRQLQNPLTRPRICPHQRASAHDDCTMTFAFPIAVVLYVVRRSAIRCALRRGPVPCHHGERQE